MLHTSLGNSTPSPAPISAVVISAIRPPVSLPGTKPLKLLAEIARPVTTSSEGSGDPYLAFVRGMVMTRRDGGMIYTGSDPRYFVPSPNGKIVYATISHSDDVVKILRRTGEILGVVHTGSVCRSLAISSNGTTLYVVSSISDTMTMLRANNLRILQTIPTSTRPVDVTFDPITGQVWVVVSSGEHLVFGPS